MAKRKKTVTLPKVSAQNILKLDGDGPTPERLAKLPGVTIRQKASGARVVVLEPGTKKPVGEDGVVRVADAPLDRLAARNRLHETDPDRNAKLHEAGERLRQHWYQAGLGGAVGSVDLNRTGGGNGDPAWLMPTGESAAHHRQKFRSARDGMEPGHWEVVFGVCCGEATLESAGKTAGYANRHAAAAVALDRLRRGLELLAIAWGILPPAPVNDNAAQNPAARVRTTVVRGDDVEAMVDRMVIANAAEAMRCAG